MAFLINYHLAYAIIFKIEAIIFAVVFIMFIGIPNKYSAKNILIIIENDTGEEMYDKKTNIAMYTLSDYNLEQSQKSFPLIDRCKTQK